MQTLESNIPGTISNQLMYTLYTHHYTEFMTYHNIHSYTTEIQLRRNSIITTIKELGPPMCIRIPIYFGFLTSF